MKTGLRLLVMVAGALVGSAQATLLNVHGEFTIGSAQDPVPDIGVFSGSFSFTFDGSGIPASGVAGSGPITLDAFTVSPNYGGFDISNTFGYMEFIDGAVDQVFLGTESSHPLDSIYGAFAGTNDFFINYNESPYLNDFVVTTASNLEWVDEESGLPYSGSVWVTALVPEPASLGLLGGMLLVLTGVRRLRGASTQG